MKKVNRILSIIISGPIAASCIPLTASAAPDLRGETLPFELEAPTNVSMTGLNGGDSETSLNIAFSMNNSMCKWLSDDADPESHNDIREKLLSENGLDDISVSAQIDWAIDDPVNGWHYTKYWDGEEFTNDEGKTQWAGLGMDKDFQYRTGDWDVIDCWIYPVTVNDSWIMRSLTINNDPTCSDEEKKQANEWFFGNDHIPGLKNQLKDDQYTLVEADPDNHDQAIFIDWTQHTAYARVRWAVVLSPKDKNSFPVFSDWSETAVFGKDATPFVPLKKEDLAAPVISNLRYYPEEFNGYPQIACTLTVPDELNKNLTEISSRGGEIRIEWEARIPGGEWIGQQGGETITAGENVVSLIFLAESIIRENSENGISTPEVILAEGSPIELRARYWCNQYESYTGDYIGEFWSDYSEVLTFGAQEMSHTEESVAESSKDETESSKITESPKDKESKCPLCGFCPQPLGLCIFIWILIIVVLIVVVVVVVILVKKNKKDDDDNK